MREELRKLLKEADSDVCKIVQNRFPSDVRTVWELLADQLIAKDVVPVVRCKKCKFWERLTDGNLCGACNGQRNGLTYEYTTEDDFCSYGERREGE